MDFCEKVFRTKLFITERFEQLGPLPLVELLEEFAHAGVEVDGDALAVAMNHLGREGVLWLQKGEEGVPEYGIQGQGTNFGGRFALFAIPNEEA